MFLFSEEDKKKTQYVYNVMTVVRSFSREYTHTHTKGLETFNLSRNLELQHQFQQQT